MHHFCEKSSIKKPHLSRGVWRNHVVRSANNRSSVERGCQEKRSEIAPRFVIICVLSVKLAILPTRQPAGGRAVPCVFWPGVSSKILSFERTFDTLIQIRRSRSICHSFMSLRKPATERGRLPELLPTWFVFFQCISICDFCRQLPEPCLKTVSLWVSLP